jgi:sulfonate transport system substrate-binding protein
MKNFLTVSVVLIVLFIGLSGCSDKKQATEVKGLRVAVQSFYASCPVGLIVTKGWDKEAGIPFELSVFSGGAPINEALAAKKWDVAVTGGAFIYAVANFDAKLIAHQIDGSGGNGMYVRPNSKLLSAKGTNPNFPEVYGTPEMVKGLTILHNTGTTSQYITVNYLKALGVNPDDVKTIHADFQQLYQAFLTNKGDMVALTAPHSFKGDAEGWKMVANLTTLNSKMYEATVCTKEVYESRQADMVKFVKLLYRATDAMLADPKLKFDVVKKWYADNGKTVSDADVQKEIDLKPFVGSAEAKQMDLGKFATSIGQFYVSVGLIEPQKIENIKKGIAYEVFKEGLK